MTNLGCQVCNCMYNEDDMCCKGSINVDGENAREAKCTCCSSFKDKECGCAKNSTNTPKAKIEVKCSATNCMYNDGMNCSAGHIDVTHCGGSGTDQTECSTFVLR